MTRIVFEDVSKIYGDRPRQVQEAMALLRQNVPSDEIFARTGCRVGLRHISLEIPSGGIFCVIGLSGSGKSTLVRHINRLIEPTCGRIQACDIDVTALDARGLREFRRSRVSMVFQHFGLLPHLTVMQNTCRPRSSASVPATGCARWNWPTWPTAIRSSSRAACASAWGWRGR